MVYKWRYCKEITLLWKIILKQLVKSVGFYRLLQPLGSFKYIK